MEINKYLQKIYKNKKETIPLFDGPILRLHYRWTFIIMLVGFLTVAQQWYQNDIMVCRNMAKIERKHEELDSTHMNICLSYPYVEDDDRRYLLFYRWIHISFLFLALIYYIPRIISKKSSISLSDDETRLLQGFIKESDYLEDSVKYTTLQRGTHDGLYRKYLYLNIFALALDILTMYFLHILLQQRFLTYGLYIHNMFVRNPQEFDDYISKIFPPFVKCHIGEVNLITSTNEITYGCHLTLMELYEKIFMIIWWWLVILIIATLWHITCLIYMGVKVGPLSYFSNSKRDKVGDSYLNYRLKSHLNSVRYNNLGLHDMFKSHIIPNDTVQTDYSHLENNIQSPNTMQTKYPDLGWTPPAPSAPNSTKKNSSLWAPLQSHQSPAWTPKDVKQTTRNRYESQPLQKRVLPVQTNNKNQDGDEDIWMEDD